MSPRIVPTIGRIVLYCLSQQDAAEINRRRTDGNHIAQRLDQGKWPAGAQAHIGNKVAAGDVFPGMVVRVFTDDLISIKVELDGTDSFWATSRHCSEEARPGMYHWMPYQKAQASAQIGSEIPVTPSAPLASLGTVVPSEPIPVDGAGTVIEQPAVEAATIGSLTDAPDAITAASPVAEAVEELEATGPVDETEPG